MKLQMPKLSATMDSGRIAKWLKRKGDAVASGDILYELETDKAVMEVESPVDGVLEDIWVEEGAEAAAGADVCGIRTAGSAKEEAVTAVVAPEEPIVADVPDELPGGRFRASPSARRIAQELKLDIRTVQGSGPLGRVRNRDVIAAVEDDKPEYFADSPLPAADRKETGPLRYGAGVTPMRRIIACEMVRSQQTIPDFWVEKWVSAERLLEWKEWLKQTADHERSPLTVTDFLIQAVGLALENRPSVNRRWTEQGGAASIEQASGSHIGLAVSVEEGILVPVIEHAGASCLFEIAAKRREAVQSPGRPASAAAQPAFLTISNLGATGIDRFRAIVRPDESMILAVGALQERIVPSNGQAVAQKGFSLTLSADHRVIDGMEAALFLADIARIIETGRWRLSR